MRLRDTAEFWAARDRCEELAKLHGGHWCVCYLEARQQFRVVALQDADMVPSAERHFKLFKTYGGRFRPTHPLKVSQRRERVCRRLCEVVEEIGGAAARRWARYLEMATEHDRMKAVQSNRHAAIIWAFQTLV